MTDVTLAVHALVVGRGGRGPEGFEPGFGPGFAPGFGPVGQWTVGPARAARLRPARRRAARWPRRPR